MGALVTFSLCVMDLDKQSRRHCLRTSPGSLSNVTCCSERHPVSFPRPKPGGNVLRKSAKPHAKMFEHEWKIGDMEAGHVMKHGDTATTIGEREDKVIKP